MIIDVPKKWRCVIAEKHYKYWDTVEECECIQIPPEQKSILVDTIINSYWFDWTSWPLLLLWNGSLYNHRHEWNIQPVLLKNWKMQMMARKTIKPWEELVFDYWYSLKERPQPPVYIEGIQRDGKFIKFADLISNNTDEDKR